MSSSSDHSYMYVELLDAPEPIKSALSFVSRPVLDIQSSKMEVQKYSVVVNDDVEFIHIFCSNINDEWYISCQSGLCQHSFGKKRNMKRLDSMENICSHLEVFKQAMQNKTVLINPDLITKVDGLHGEADSDHEAIEDDDASEEDEDNDDVDDVVNEGLDESKVYTQNIYK